MDISMDLNSLQSDPAEEHHAQAVAICEAGGVAETRSITVRSVPSEKYDRITHHELGPIPPLPDGNDERDDGNLPEYLGPEGDSLPF